MQRSRFAATITLTLTITLVIYNLTIYNLYGKVNGERWMINGERWTEGERPYFFAFFRSPLLPKCCSRSSRHRGDAILSPQWHNHTTAVTLWRHRSDCTFLLCKTETMKGSMSRGETLEKYPVCDKQEVLTSGVWCCNFVQTTMTTTLTKTFFCSVSNAE